MPFVCIVVLNYNGAQLTVNCVNSVLQSDYPNFRVIVVDNSSADDSVARLREAFTDPRTELFINDSNEGYAGGNNRGIEKALSQGAEYIFVLNNDTIADPGCLGSLVSAMEANPRIGIGGCQEVAVGKESIPNQGQQLNLFTGKATLWRHRETPSGPVDVDFICGVAMMLRANMLRDVGGFDPNFFMYCEDADICFRARKAGYRVCFIPGPGVRHFMSSTSRAPRVRALVYFCSGRNRIWLIRRHGRLEHQIVFALLTFCYGYPKICLGRIGRREFYLLGVFFKAVWHGYRGYSQYAGSGLSINASESGTPRSRAGT